MTILQAQTAVITIAVGNLGYLETGNNVTKFAAGQWDNKFYGWELQGQPWCDVFADYCYCQAFGDEKGAAITYQKLGRGSALCSTSAQYYKNNNAFFKYPQKADQAFFNYNGGINHTGIVESVNGSGENWTSFTCIEGNSSDQVVRHTYYKGDNKIAGFGRPNWSLVTGSNENSTPAPTPTPDPAPTATLIRFGDKGNKVKELQEKLIKLGYNCGKFGADGEFGVKTLAAVTKFQREHLLEVDGIAGPETIKALNKALDSLNEEIVIEPEKPTSFQVGDKVKVKEGSTYYNSNVKVPNFVLNDTWIIYAINGNRAVINKNVSGTNAIMSPINTQDLIKV